MSSELAAQATDEAEPAAGSALKVAVLRATEGQPGPIAEQVDGALLRDLAALAGIENPTVSPIDYAEIQLTVGCSDEGRQCLSSIAQMVQVDAVVVRKLVFQPGRARLELVYLDTTASDDPARAEQIDDGDAAGDDLPAAVPSLVRRLFGIPEPVTAAPPDESRPASGAESGYADAAAEPRASSGIGPLTWVSLGVGAAALGVGIALGVTAQSGFDDYKTTAIDDEDDAERASDKFDQVKSQGLVATILIPTGAALLALGATLLVLDLTSDDAPAETSLALRPLDGGALLSLRARAEGL